MHMYAYTHSHMCIHRPLKGQPGDPLAHTTFLLWSMHYVPCASVSCVGCLYPSSLFSQTRPAVVWVKLMNQINFDISFANSRAKLAACLSSAAMKAGRKATSFRLDNSIGAATKVLGRHRATGQPFPLAQTQAKHNGHRP